MRIVLSDRDPATLAVDALLLAFEDVSDDEKLPLSRHLARDAKLLAPVTAETCAWVSTRRCRAERALLGKLSALSSPDDLAGGACGSPTLEGAETALRRDRMALGAKMERACVELSSRRVVLWTGEDIELGLDLLEGMSLRSYAFDEMMSEPELGLRQVTWAVSGAVKAEAKSRLKLLQAKIAGCELARRFADLPPNLAEPVSLVARFEPALTESGLRCEAMGSAELNELGMGLFRGVARGSNSEAQLWTLEYRPEGVDGDAPPDLALVGKGVTIDAGGYNLKSSGIHDMNYDKAGAAAVVGAMLAIAQAQLPLHVIAACPLVENLLGEDALRPGEILTSYAGRSVFIENTDAEGRLVLADTLAWIAEREPARVIDLATLTSASHVALGEPYAALFSNDDELRDALLAAGRTSGEGLWPLPIHEIHDRELAHPRADLRNVGTHAGGASAAAAFLRYFVSGPWAHIDLAGKAANAYERDYMGPGATGFGTRLLFRLAQDLAQDLARSARKGRS